MNVGVSETASFRGLFMVASPLWTLSIRKLRVGFKIGALSLFVIYPHCPPRSIA